MRYVRNQKGKQKIRERGVEKINKTVIRNKRRKTREKN
jgi:hypothetical protein